MAPSSIKRFKLKITSIFKNLQGISPRLRKMNHSYAKADLEHSLTTMLGLQFAELKQLDVTGNFGEHGIRESACRSNRAPLWSGR